VRCAKGVRIFTRDATNDDGHSRREDNERGGRGCVRVLYTGNLYVLKSMEGPEEEAEGRLMIPMMMDWI
jgi:hypothetical protein